MSHSKTTVKLRLYVWDGFAPDYTPGLAFAVAASEDEARKMIIKRLGYDPDTWGDLTVCRIDRRVARAETGGG